MKPTLAFLHRLARQAGEILRAGFGQNLQVDYKGAINLVTEMDRKSERFLMAAIQDDFPGHAIQAEESGGRSGQLGKLWIIDPLDGTVNYAHGIPIFSVSIAFAEDGIPILGVVYDPLRDECFSAERGQGAFLNEHRIQPSEATDLAHSLLVTGFPYDAWANPENNLDNFARFVLRTQGVRRLGSAALDLCYVAAGRFDGYWELRLQPWDVAAGALIAQEAGALVTDISGGPDFMVSPPSVLVANRTLHPLMLAVLQEDAPP